ncbi:MAG: hypothetical protein CMG57_06080 [Candidatus Marinimicrobia bacterium]|nr:hypothetical protein [Candidatus Neomarinimicrobiota bacterium]
MHYKKVNTAARLYLLLVFCTSLTANKVQLITTHKKSNGTLLRIVTSQVMNIDNIAGWVGQENWFYVTLNAATLDLSSVEYIKLEPPLMDIDATENNESVQLGYLFDKPISDFEIFHSEASRVILVQVWESLNDSLRTEVRTSENQNNNSVFSLPKNESKGSPFYDSFIYARDKYGPERYFVWYNDWYSTKDIIGDDGEINNTIDKGEPRPLVVKNHLKEKIPPLKSHEVEIVRQDVDISQILDRGMLSIGMNRPVEVKSLQRALVALGYDLGDGGVYNNGVDGEFGPTTEEAVKRFQRDRGMVGVEVDGVVGEITYLELERALEDSPSVGEKIESSKPTEAKEITQKIQDIDDKPSQELFVLETAKEILKKPSSKKQTKRETRKLDNPELMKTLTPDFTKRKTFLKLTCNLDGADVFINGNLIGQTPIPKKLPVNPGWHRVKVIDPNAPPPQFSMAIPDYQDIYIPVGKTQNIRINLAIPEQETPE